METEFPTNFTVRPAEKADLPGILALLNADQLDQVGEGNEVRSTWQLADVLDNLAANTRLVFAPDGELVACGLFQASAPYVRLNCATAVAPAYQGQGIGTMLARWAEARARECIPQAPAGARVALLQEPLSTNVKARELLLGQGYEWTRSFSRMVVEMDGPPPAPVVPDGLTIRTFQHNKKEVRALVEALRDIFSDHWGHVDSPIEPSLKWWPHIIENDPDVDPSLWFLAVAGDEIAGVALSCPKLLEDPDMGYIWLLGVRRPWRRRGLGLALLQQAFGAFYARGQHKVSLSVDAQSLTKAVQLYERGGMHPMRQYDYYEKELRTGEDLSLRTL